MQNKKNVVIAILAVVAVVFAVLFFVTNADKGKLADTKAGLDTQVEKLNGEKESLESQVATLKDEAVQAAETAKAELDKAVGDVTVAAQGQIDEAVKAKEDAETALQAAQDEAAKVKEEAETALQAAQDEAAKAKEAADAALQTAQDEAAKAKEEAAAAQGQVEEAVKAKEAAETELQAAQEEAAKAKEEATAAQGQIDEAVKAKEAAEIELQAALDKAAAEAAQQEPAAALTAGDIDFAAVFPSWNPDSASLKELVDFVLASVDESGSGYIAPADRIATFDMDGTIICEKAPIYIDSCLTMHRVLDDPTYNATEEQRAAMQEMRDHAYATGENYKPKTLTKDDVIGPAFAGMTAAEFRAYVVDFADNTDAVGFSGMTYGQSFYKPMLEVIDFLRAYGYDVWMVSACEREVVRAIVERLGFPYDHVVATDVVYSASGSSEGVPADDYNMGQEEEIVLSGPLEEVECGKSGKPVKIAREIGKRPVIAFGNSSGDYSMLNYAEGNPDHPGMGVLVVCDDTVREYGSETKAADFYNEVEKQGWTAFSMANDWLTIYGDGVEKTGLPGAEEALPDAA